MKIQIVTPAGNAALNGNQVTAQRWARILQQLRHQVSVGAAYNGGTPDLLVALHAFKSYDSIRRFREQHSSDPLIVVLTGTDLYRDLPVRRAAHESLELATCIIVLQKEALNALPERWRAKTRVIYQSAEPFPGKANPPSTHFQVCVIGHLREEKDPFRTARAARELPASSRIQVVQVGHPLNPEMEDKVLKETQSNPRYQWLGQLPHEETRQLLAGSHLVVISSRMEGSSNVLAEALASGVPVIASRIPGLIGTLGEDYPGYFPVEDTGALTKLLQRVETDQQFYEELQLHCARAAPLVAPERERLAWKELLQEITAPGGERE